MTEFSFFLVDYPDKVSDRLVSAGPGTQSGWVGI